jgi:hypothetical protein
MGKIERRLVGISNTLLQTDSDTGSQELQAGTYTAEEAFSIGETQYVFLFWTVDGYPNLTDPPAKAIHIPEGHLIGTKWYLQAGGGPGDPRVWVHAFSMGMNKFVTASPVAQADPSESLTGNEIATKGVAVKLIAKDALGGFRDSEPFHHWWWTGMSGQIQVWDPVLELTEDATGQAIAYFGHPKSESIDVGRVTAEHLTMSKLWRHVAVVAEMLDQPMPPDYMKIALARQASQHELARIASRVEGQALTLARLAQRLDELEGKVQAAANRGRTG